MVTSHLPSSDLEDFRSMSAAPSHHVTRAVAVIGGGPAGLMAAEALAAAGLRVDVFDSMPSVGRKFLMAGKGGMNLTHSEPIEPFLARYGSRRDSIAPLLDLLSPAALRAWVQDLGVATFVGTSGRVFPTDMKAAPLLRAWLHRLRENGVRFHMRHRWIGWETPPRAHEAMTAAASASSRATASAGNVAHGNTADAGQEVASDENLRLKRHALRFATPEGDLSFEADAVVLALGGGSWPRLGSDAAWVPLLAARGIEISPLQAANCGFDADWSEHFRSRHAGEYIKSVAMSIAPGDEPAESLAGADAGVDTGIHAGIDAEHKLQGEPAAFRQGEFVVTESGIEGSLVYALSSTIRERINRDGHATLLLDLVPGLSHERVLTEVTHPRGSRSMSSHLRSRLGISGVKAGLLHECLSKEAFALPEQLAAAIKSLPVKVVRARPIAEAISSAGGIPFEALDSRLMIRQLPGIFCAGEMLDWEAPTGGYLLTACFASGLAAGQGVIAWLNGHSQAAIPT
jgi:predicted flavoprotein YhiN